MNRFFLCMLITIFIAACSHPKPIVSQEVREYKGVNFDKLYQKDRSYEALNNDMTEICDRILSWSSKDWTLKDSENKMLESYIRQNQLFEQPKFGKEWLNSSKAMFDRIFNDERNMIAPALYQKIEDLYFESHPAETPASTMQDSNPSTQPILSVPK